MDASSCASADACGDITLDGSGAARPESDTYISIPPLATQRRRGLSVDSSRSDKEKRVGKFIEKVIAVPAGTSRKETRLANLCKPASDLDRLSAAGREHVSPRQRVL